MNIEKKVEENNLTVKLDGRLDITTAPQLEAEVKGDLADVEHLVFEIEGLQYISSAGLRTLLSIHKIMNKKQGDMVIRGASDDVMKIFDVTGFSHILTLE